MINIPKAFSTMKYKGEADASPNQHKSKYLKEKT